MDSEFHEPRDQQEEPWLPRLLQSHAFLDGVVAHSALSGEVAGRLLSPGLVDADEMAGEARWIPHLGTTMVEMAEAIARSFEVDRSLAQPGEPPPLLVAQPAEAPEPAAAQAPSLTWPEPRVSEPSLAPQSPEARPSAQAVPQEDPPLRTLGDLLRRELARQQNPSGPAPAIPRPAPALPPAVERTAPQQRPAGAEARSLPPRRARIVELPSSPATAHPETLRQSPEPPAASVEPQPSAAAAGASLPQAADVAALAPQAPLSDVASRPVARPVPLPPGPAIPIPRTAAAEAPPEASRPQAPMAPPSPFPTPAPAGAAEAPPDIEDSPPPTTPPLDRRQMNQSSPQERPSPPAATTGREEHRPGSAAVPSAPLRTGPAAGGPEARAPSVLRPDVAPPSAQPPNESARPRPRFPLLGALVARLLGRRPQDALAHPAEPPAGRPAEEQRRLDEPPPLPQVAQEPVLEPRAEGPSEWPEPTGGPAGPARAPGPGPSDPRPSLPPVISAAIAEERPEAPGPRHPERPPGPEKPPAAKANPGAPGAVEPPPPAPHAQDSALHEPPLDGTLEEPARPDEPPRAALLPPRSGTPARASRYTLPREPEGPPAWLGDTTGSPWPPAALEHPSPPAGFTPRAVSFGWPPAGPEEPGPLVIGPLLHPDLEPALVPALAPHLPELVLAPAASDRGEPEATPEQASTDAPESGGRGGRAAPAPDTETLSREVYALLKRRIALERERGFGR